MTVLVHSIQHNAATGKTEVNATVSCPTLSDVETAIFKGKSEVSVKVLLRRASQYAAEKPLYDLENKWFELQSEIQDLEEEISDEESPDRVDTLGALLLSCEAARTKLEIGEYFVDNPKGGVTVLNTGIHNPWLGTYRGAIGMVDRPSPDESLALADTRALMLKLFQRLATEEITAPVVSDALGGDYEYNYEAENQSNLASCVALSLANNTDIKYTCINRIVDDANEGKKVRVTHTPVQLQNVLSACEAVKNAVQDNYHAKREALNAAQTLEQVLAVTWS